VVDIGENKAVIKSKEKHRNYFSQPKFLKGGHLTISRQPFENSSL
jgi:hypothetical protein